jgi:hypothetical protein
MVGRKKVVVGFGVVVLLLLATAGGIGFMLTRDIDPEWGKAPSYKDVREANRKISLFTKSYNGKNRGFVRLNQTELNSILFDQLGRPRTNKVVLDPDLVRAGVKLSSGNFSLYCWSKKQVGGYPVQFAWERIFTPQKTDKGWTFRVSELHVGDVKIPETLWPQVYSLLGSTDKLLTDGRNWVANIPWIELGKNEMTDLAELRLYNYLPASSRGSK